MKRVDVTKSVMDRVTRFEKERSHSWLWRSRIFIGVLFVGVLWALWMVWDQLRARQTLDMLSLFWEDAEIIQEFWQDTIIVFLEELPREALVVAGIVLVGLFGYIWLTHKKRAIMKKRLTQLAKKK
jgi:hypothetical protein